MVRGKKWAFFLGPKSRFLVQKSDFCHTTPILVDDPFLALGMKVNFPPWKPFFDFPFRSYSCFRKKIWLTAQKVFPPPTVGVPSASKSLSALSAQALRAWLLLLSVQGPRWGLCCDAKTIKDPFVHGSKSIKRMWQYEELPHPHRRPHRPTVTSPGWILQRRSVGWNLADMESSCLTSLDNLGHLFFIIRVQIYFIHLWVPLFFCPPCRVGGMWRTWRRWMDDLAKKLFKISNQKSNNKTSWVIIYMGILYRVKTCIVKRDQRLLTSFSMWQNSLINRASPWELAKQFENNDATKIANIINRNLGFSFSENVLTFSPQSWQTLSLKIT